MIISTTELQSVERLVAELESEVSEFGKLEQTPDVVLAIDQRRQQVAGLKSEIAAYKQAGGSDGSN